MALKLGIFDIIQGAVTTGKATEQMHKLKKITLTVHLEANKSMVKEAVEKAFNVKVKDINILIKKGKIRKFKRVESRGKDTKRAIVTLSPGYSIGLFDQQAMGAGVEQSPEQ
ncbi:MAG: 50S ribosomal protein L23 [Candidatus Babeliales bacterium]